MESRTVIFPSENHHEPVEDIPPISAAEWRQTFNTLVGDSLLPVSTGLGVLFTIFAISHVRLLPGGIALPMSLVAAATALIFLITRILLGHARLSRKSAWAHPLGAMMAGLVLVNSLLHLYLTAEPIQTTNLVLLVIGVGFLFLSLSWLGLILIATFGGWAAIAWMAPPSPGWNHFGFALLSASFLAVLINLARRRTLKRLEGFRRRDEHRKIELENALAATEEARRMAEASKHHLMKSEASLRLLTSRMPAVLWTTDTELRFTSTLGMGLAELELNADQVAGMTLFEYFQTQARDFPPIAAHERALKGESVIYQSEWKGRLFDCKVEPLHDAEKRLIGVIGIALDITESKRAEEQIKFSLKEKELLLKEIHNRVKNNLQVISSLLNLQAGYIQDEQARARFKESRDRLKAMVLIHEKLYQSEDLTAIDFGGYIRNLAVHLFRSHQVDARVISLHLDVEPLYLDIDRATSCGLIINELVSNAIKYAFPNGKRGEICIGVHKEAQQQIVLSVSDNGAGLAKDLDFRQAQSLGFQLINTLTEQLGGTITLDREGGTRFTLAFHH
ncbi:MAG: ATP-binding protein [candidate division KSB1 bacterium]|nr:ATP-binding protein [candidate division KSB1 bacterium]MDZ7365773.1 ATP-binding protein [candidate division KSB1 bacterium]MDZ7403748.1 ATP-binding protein [candidate division KSB1 bacterium]